MDYGAQKPPESNSILKVSLGTAVFGDSLWDSGLVLYEFDQLHLFMCMTAALVHALGYPLQNNNAVSPHHRSWRSVSMCPCPTFLWVISINSEKKQVKYKTEDWNVLMLSSLSLSPQLTRRCSPNGNFINSYLLEIILCLVWTSLLGLKSKAGIQVP